MDLVELLQLASSTSLGIALTVYLVYWITTKLESRLNDITHKLEDLNTTLEKFISLLEKIIPSR